MVNIECILITLHCQRKSATIAEETTRKAWISDESLPSLVKIFM